MSLFKQCDRCGATMSPTGGFTVNIKECGASLIVNDIYGFDLCVKCNDRLRVFLKGEDIEIVEE